MVSVQFNGDKNEIDDAEEWCRGRINEGYFVRHTRASESAFQFACPFEAQRFRDRHREHTGRLMFDDQTAW